MQKKDNIKNIVFFCAALLIGEGVFGLGLFWPFLFAMKDQKYALWSAFVAGLFLSAMYNQGVGLMSLYLTVVVVLAHFFMSSGRGFGKLVFFCSVAVNFLFNYLFGLSSSYVEIVGILVISVLFSRSIESQETIRISVS